MELETKEKKRLRKAKEARLKFRQSKGGVLSAIYNGQRQSSNRRGHKPPEYSLNELKEATLAMPLFDTLYQTWVDSGYDTLLKPSYDRENDYIGYTKDNIELKTWGENKERVYTDKKKGINNKVNKAVKQFTKTGEYIATYYSTMEAMRQTNINSSGIAKCCNNRRNFAGGFTWKYDK